MEGHSKFLEKMTRLQTKVFIFLKKKSTYLINIILNANEILRVEELTKLIVKEQMSTANP